MGRTHSNAFLQAPRFFDLPYAPVLKAVAARNADRLRTFADTWGYQSAETDWRALVERKDIDLIDIASPNDTHAEIAIAAAKAGKMVTCEKPLGRTAAEAQAMVAAVEKAGVAQHGLVQLPPRAGGHADQAADRRGQAGPHLSLPRQVPAGLDDLEDLPQGGEGLWRLDVGVAGSGVTGDLLAHCIDTAIWLNGGIDKVTAMTETFIKERKHNLTGKVENGRDRRCVRVPGRFDNGSLATFESTRYARGHKALYTLEINGEHASTRGTCTTCTGCSSSIIATKDACAAGAAIHVTDGDHPYMKHWWVPGLQIGYEHTFIHQFADFLTGLGAGKETAPTFRDGLATDCVTDAVLKSARTRQWEVPKRSGGVKERKQNVEEKKGGVKRLYESVWLVASRGGRFLCRKDHRRVAARRRAVRPRVRDRAAAAASRIPNRLTSRSMTAGSRSSTGR